MVKAGTTPAKPPMPPAKQIGGAILAITLGFSIALIPPPGGLTVQSMKAIGILVWAIFSWFCRLMPDYIVALAMCALWALFGVVPFPQAFGAFSSTNWWILIGALGIGLAVDKSGLLKRISLLVLKLFPPTFSGQVLALLASGTIAAPFIPSTTAKCAIAAPLAMDIADTLGLKKKSKGRAGLFCAMYTGFSLTGTIFVSASYFGYTVLGVLPTDLQAQFNWIMWFLGMLPWATVVMVGSYVFIIRAYKPDTDDGVPVNYIQTQLAALGPMSYHEKITLAVLAICFIFWIGETFIGVAAVYPAVLGVCVLMGCDVFGAREFNTKMVWNLIIFIGSVLNLAIVLPAVGIDNWVAAITGPFLTRFIKNIYLFIIAVTLIIYGVRALIASAAGTMTLFTVMLTPLAVEAGINPWIVGIISYVSVMIWYLPYHNAGFLAAFAASGGEETVAYKSTLKMCFAYMTLSLLGLLISVPYWRWMKLLP